MEPETEENKLETVEDLEAIRRSGQEVVALEGETPRREKNKMIEAVEGESQSADRKTFLDRMTMVLVSLNKVVAQEYTHLEPPPPPPPEGQTAGKIIFQEDMTSGIDMLNTLIHEYTHIVREKKKMRLTKVEGQSGSAETSRNKIVFRNIGYAKWVSMTAYSIIQETESGFSISPYDKMLGFDANLDDDDDDDPRQSWFVNMLPYPLQAHTLMGSTNAVWQSEIFFISGKFQRTGHHFSDTVIGFNTKQKKWKVYPPIQTPRAYHTAVAVRGSIYVFGNIIIFKPTSMDHWGERFNISQQAWDYLPSPPLRLYELRISRAHAVYYTSQAFSYTTVNGVPAEPVPRNQNLILFPLPGLGSPICVFNCNTNSWLPDIYPKLPESAPPIYPFYIERLRNQLAVVDGVLFWHHGGSIHGYDLIKQEYLHCLFTLPCNQQHKPPNDCRDEGCRYFDPPMYLVHPGDRKLFFIFQKSCNKRNIHCNKFQVLPNKQGEKGPRLCLVPEAYSLLSTNLMNLACLEDVLVL